MVCLGRQLSNRAQLPTRVEYDPAVFLVADAWNSLRKFSRLDVPDHFEHRIFALSDHHDVDKLRGQRLIRQQRRMPAAQNDRFVRIEPLGFPRDFDGLADHRPGDQGNRQA